MQTGELINAIKHDIEKDLFNKIMSEIRPVIQEHLYANVFTFQETMKYLKLSESTLRRMVKEKTVPFFKQRELLYFRQIDLDKYIADAVKRESAG